jgi:hypothetical protein
VSAANWLQLVALVGALLVTAPLLGAYLGRVLGSGAALGDRFFLPVERVLYRVAGVDPGREQPWNVYALSLLAFSAVSEGKRPFDSWDELYALADKLGPRDGPMVLFAAAIEAL